MKRIARIHLDPVGGIAGDMFAAALADAFPECVPGLLEELGKLGEGTIRFAPHRDATLRGQRFIVEGAAAPEHAHVRHAAIRERLGSAQLDPRVLDHALGLFALLAEAEAKVHGIAVDDVEFHELGAWDSIVDFVAAAYFIARLAPARWTWSPLPLGGGRVRTAHGMLPVPTPATALLLEGLEVIDDGIGGERVTPTGAAIVRYLSNLQSGAGERPPGRADRVASSGFGFGTRTLPGVPNVLRSLAFAEAAMFPAPPDEEIGALQFEIDDQTAEDLAVALDRIRAAPGVLDACQLAVYGKKGRLGTQVQVLACLDAVDEVAALCLEQTTTLGVRVSRVWRRTTLRAQVPTSVPGNVRVKLAERPSGKITAKAEMDDLAEVPGERARREEIRRRAESSALEATRTHGRDPDHD